MTEQEQSVRQATRREALRVGSEVFMRRHASADPFHMAYIVERKDRFYVVAYDGIDPITRR